LQHKTLCDNWVTQFVGAYGAALPAFSGLAQVSFAIGVAHNNIPDV
jgi:hypothetical protein